MKNIPIYVIHTHTHTHTLPIFTPTYIVYIIVTYLSSCHVRLTEEELYPNCVCISHSVMSNSCNPMDCIPPGSSVHGILQSRILEWVAMPSSRKSSQPRDWTWVPCIAGRFFTTYATREALILMNEKMERETFSKLSLVRLESYEVCGHWFPGFATPPFSVSSPCLIYITDTCLWIFCRHSYV